MVGALALTGMPDAQSKPVLVCSLNDNTVRLYDLPSFSDRGRIFSKQEIRAIQTGPGGLFFTGDGTVQFSVISYIYSPKDMRLRWIGLQLEHMQRAHVVSI
ncbi:unnamed protein product [Triticum turgidum subsp. durum]|uniref:Uncharacterized protein n=1 Tax=Triticum turgidum subsp. durum TaxID=4567 RepID=A0A9R0Y453_TRITD|nr:unnamed protein product [Triticum turgidum subsp. durum]